MTPDTTRDALTPADLDQIFAGYLYLPCRRRGHKFPDEDDDGSVRRDWEIVGHGAMRTYIQVYECVRCGTTKTLRRTPLNEKLDTRYKYEQPKDEPYRMEPGVRVSKEDICAWEFDKFLEAEREKERVTAARAKAPAKSTRTRKPAPAQRTTTRRRTVSR